MKSKFCISLGVLAVVLGVVAVTLHRDRHGSAATSMESACRSTAGAGMATDANAIVRSGDPIRDFESWMAGGPARFTPASIEEGVRMARQRLEALRRLMKQDPAAAIGEMMPLDELAALPAEVRAHCEQPFSAVGDIDLIWATTIEDDGSLACEDRTRVYANGTSWRAWGPRLIGGPMPRSHVPLTGWKIGGELLLAPSPVRRLTMAERAVADEWFPEGNPDGLDPLTGAEADPGAAAVIGGRVFQFQNEASIGQVAEILRHADEIAVTEHRYQVDSGIGWIEAEGGGEPTVQGPVEATPWQDDMIDVLFIRADFSDFPGEPVSKTALESTLSTVNSDVNHYSYGNAALAYTVTTQLYRMPDTGASYATSATGNDDLITDARAAASADYTLSNYDVVAVFFPDLSGVPGSQITYAGRASVGGGNHWVNGANNVAVILHEFGHNFGLRHANYWDPTQGISGSYNDPAHSSLEYGDIFDRMGKGSAPNGYFNPYATNQLDWLPDSKVAQAGESGTWRIHRFDDPNALSNQYLALRVPMGAGVYYWIGHRKLYGPGHNLDNGAYVVAEGLFKSNYGPDRPNLIDMTPGSATPESYDREDAGLPKGSSWTDPNAGVTIKVVDNGGTAPNEWIDVEVTFESRISVAQTWLEVDEQQGVASVVLRRALSGAGEATVHFTTSDGTALAGADYYAASGTVSWADGETGEKTVKIPIRPDAAAEGSEQFSVVLSNATGAVLDTTADTATVTILDPGRRYDGFAPGFFNTTVHAVAPLPDGRVVIGGDIGAGIGDSSDIRHIARLLADGSVDPSFQTGTGFDAPVKALAVQQDGKIVIGGEFTQYNGTACNHVVRLNADGTIDAGFVAAMGGGADDTVNAVAVESSGTILIGGKFANFDGAATPKHMVRLTQAGARDTVNPLNLGFSANEILTILAQSDGKIMVGGVFFYYSWAAGDISGGMARLHADGTRDTTFDPGNGAGDASSAYTITNVHSIARQADGKYLVGGSFTAFDGHPASRVARLGSDGAFDATFTAPAFDNTVYALVAQGNGMAVAGGAFASPAGHIERMTSSGAADPGFQQGTGTTGSFGGNVYAIAEGKDGALWVGGNFFTYDDAACRPVVKIAGGVAPYDRWAAQHFTPDQVAAGLNTEDADPDGDGLSNLSEMACASDPNGFDNRPAFGRVPPGGFAVAEVSGSQYLQVTFEKVADAAGIWYAAQFSSDLASWSPTAPGPDDNSVYEVVEDSSRNFTVRDKTPMDGESRRFARLVLIRPE